jgi:hypothetical protein
MEWSGDQNNSLYPALIGIFVLVLAMTMVFNAGQLAEVAAEGTKEPPKIMVPPVPAETRAPRKRAMARRRVTKIARVEQEPADMPPKVLSQQTAQVAAW